ncbi:MAG TPA: NIPSNAP family protein [Candidatus Dormibacteraeota bacterium]|nr:NIPSNAP family protein [Candidatus Dormibacteraeota bacterium]
MIFQLREYTVNPGEMDEWIAEWRSKIVPLRAKHGFVVVGAWTVDESEQFVWILKYDGPKSWKEADADYYASPERKAMSPDPARHLANTGARFMRSRLGTD